MTDQTPQDQRSYLGLTAAMLDSIGFDPKGTSSPEP